MNKFAKNVLIIEDHEVLGNTMKRVLKHFFSKEIVLSNFKNLVYEKTDFRNYDFLICNVNSKKDLKTLQLVNRIKQKYKHIKVLAITESPSKELERYTKNIGVDSLLSKPFSLDEILQPIKKGEKVAC